MLYCFCLECGMRYPKGRKKKVECPRCGSDHFWEEDIPASQLDLADHIADEGLKEK